MSLTIKSPWVPNRKKRKQNPRKEGENAKQRKKDMSRWRDKDKVPKDEQLEKPTTKENATHGSKESNPKNPKRVLDLKQEPTYQTTLDTHE